MQTQLGTILILQIIIDNSINFATPLVNYFYSQKKAEDIQQKASVKREQSEPEIQSELVLAPTQAFVEYDAIAIQYGYITLFVVAFPLGPLLALVNNYVINYANAYKVLILRTRPIPFGAEDIGAWYTVFEGLSIAAVLTNICLICFQTNQISTLAGNHYSDYGLVWVAVILEHFILGLKFLVAFLIPDDTKFTINNVNRSKYLVNTVMRGMEEDIEEDFEFEVAVDSGNSDTASSSEVVKVVEIEPTMGKDEHMSNFLKD